MTEEAYPAVTTAEYELRFTFRALDDLRCKRDTPPGNLAHVRTSTAWPGIVDDFKADRGDDPCGSRGPLQGVGRPDIFKMAGGTSGGRAVTWYDEENRVCWFLGYTPDHDYDHFVTLAANDELLPTEDDEVALDLERDEADFGTVIQAGLDVLIERSLEDPGMPARGTVGDLLQLEISCTAVEIDDSTLIDLYLVVRMPPLYREHQPPPGWPGSELLPRLAELATGVPFGTLDVVTPITVPETRGSERPVDLSKEVAIVVRNWEPA